MKAGFIYSAAVSATALLSVATTTYAQSSAESVSLEEIVVTAQKRSEDVQKTAISVATITGEEAIKKGNINMDDMLKDMVGVNVQPIGFGSAVNIRGMGWDLPVGVGESPVSVNFDGAANNNVQSTIFGFMDMERVEVLRGPQGTLYGRNATAGAVNVVSTAPDTSAIGGYGLLELGNYSHRRLEGAINLPINDSNAVRISASDVKRDGYMSTGAGDVDGTAVRGKYLFKPGDNFKLELSASLVDLGGISPDTNVSAANYLAGRPYVSTATSPNQQYDFKSHNFGGNIDAAIGPGTLTFIPSYEKSKAGGSTLNAFGPNVGLVTPATVSTTTQKSGELRYASPAEASLQWLVGLYYYDRKQVDDPSTSNPQGTKSGAHNEAAFANLTIPLSNTFRVNLGARAGTDEATQINPTSGDPAFRNAKANFDVFNWKVGVEADVAAEAMAYATIATSNRPGGFNVINSSGNPEFDQEDVTSYEAGLKSRWFDQRFQLNGSLFFYDYKNYQAVDIYLDTTRNPPFVGNFFNAGSARNYGAELETITLLGEATRLTLAASYLNAKFNSDIILHDSSNNAVQINGEALPRTPKWTLKGGLEHTFRLGNAGNLTANASVRWLDDQKLTAYPVTTYPVTAVEPYSVWDVNASYAPNESFWTVNLWAKNITDKVYKVSGGQDSINAGPPRMYGASVNVKF